MIMPSNGLYADDDKGEINKIIQVLALDFLKLALIGHNKSKFKSISKQYPIADKHKLIAKQ